MRKTERRTLGNGLRVVAIPIAGLRSAATVLAIEAGQWFEPQGRAGLARLMAQAMQRGTAKRDAATWAAAIDSLGASAALDVGSHAAVFSGLCLAPDVGAFLGLVAEAVVTPAFADGEIEFVRGQAIAQLEEDARNTRAVAERAWRELAYPDSHPFSRRAIGDEAVVRSLTADEVRAHHRSAITPRGAALVVAGGAEADAVFDAADRAFGSWRSDAGQERPAVPTVRLERIARRIAVVPDKAQCDVLVGWPGLSRTDPRFVAARVTNMVFAADTFASKAGHVVRDQLGLAYYVFSTLGASRGQSPWILRMGVNPANVSRAVAVALDELRKINASEIADDDLALAQDKLVGELDVARETPGGVAQLALEAELFDLGDDYQERYPRELRSVTKEQVVETARAFLTPERYAMAVAGPPLPDMPD